MNRRQIVCALSVVILVSLISVHSGNGETTPPDGRPTGILGKGAEERSRLEQSVADAMPLHPPGAGILRKTIVTGTPDNRVEQEVKGLKDLERVFGKNAFYLPGVQRFILEELTNTGTFRAATFRFSVNEPTDDRLGRNIVVTGVEVVPPPEAGDVWKKQPLGLRARMEMLQKIGGIELELTELERDPDLIKTISEGGLNAKSWLATVYEDMVFQPSFGGKKVLKSMIAAGIKPLIGQAVVDYLIKTRHYAGLLTALRWGLKIRPEEYQIEMRSFQIKMGDNLALAQSRISSRRNNTRAMLLPYAQFSGELRAAAQRAQREEDRSPAGKMRSWMLEIDARGANVVASHPEVDAIDYEVLADLANERQEQLGLKFAIYTAESFQEALAIYRADTRLLNSTGGQTLDASGKLINDNQAVDFNRVWGDEYRYLQHMQQTGQAKGILTTELAKDWVDPDPNNDTVGGQINLNRIRRDINQTGQVTGQDQEDTSSEQ